MDLDFRAAKLQFFDRPVVKAAQTGAKKPLSQFGAMIRRAAKSRLRRKQKRKTLAQLTPDERQQYEIAASQAAKAGREAPKIWFRVYSRPGEPPRVRERSPLKNLLFFGYEPNRQSVVVGPVKFKNTGAARALEHGGTTESYRFRRDVRIAPRPYMAPALAANRSKLPELFRNSIK